MKFPRRAFVHLAVGAAALPAVPRIARAQAYPSRPVRIVVGFPAGGATDIQARLMGEWLTERLGQQFIVENKPGASGNIGTETVAKAPADGYTLLQVVTPHAINAALYTNLSFDFIRDIAPVIYAARLAYVVVVNPSVPATTIPELIAYAKANPGKINYGSAGQGTPQNIACELFKMMTGVNLVHVPYKGGAPAVADLIAGHVQVIFAPVSESIQQIKAGKLRALAVTTATRLDVLPDVPTIADFVPGYEASGFAGIGVPRNTPAEIIDMLNKEINAGLADTKIKARIVELGGTVLGGTPAEFGEDHLGGHRKVGEGDQVRGHQGRIGPVATGFQILSLSRARTAPCPDHAAKSEIKGLKPDNRGGEWASTGVRDTWRLSLTEWKRCAIV